MALFEPGFARWHEFFVLAGTAGCTLLGLLFVSVSLNTDVIMRSSEKHLRAQAMNAFESLTVVMVLSLSLLVPVTSPRITGVMLLTLGIVGMVRALGHAIAASRSHARTGATSLRRRLALPVAAHLLIAWCGLLTLIGATGHEIFLFPAIVWLLITATRGAWDLLVEVGEGK